MKVLLLLIIASTVLSCQNNQADQHELRETEMNDYNRRGDSLVKITFDTLRNTLVAAIGKEGMQGAVKFCNVKAGAITSLYSQEDITITRLTDKPRNPANKLESEDSNTWKKFLDMVARNDSLVALVVARNKEVHYYKPILIQPLCLNCHGQEGNEIINETTLVIDSLYPTDMAKGYKTGDLRGMWHIAFKNKKDQ